MGRRNIQQASGQQVSTFKKFELTQEGINLPPQNRDLVGFDGYKHPVSQSFTKKTRYASTGRVGAASNKGNNYINISKYYFSGEG